MLVSDTGFDTDGPEGERRAGESVRALRIALVQRIADLAQRLQGLEKSVNGNGEVGIAEMVRGQGKSIARIEQDVRDLNSKVGGLLSDRSAAAAERKGAAEQMAQIKRWLIIVGAGLALLQSGGAEGLLNLLKELVS